MCVTFIIQEEDSGESEEAEEILGFATLLHKTVRGITLVDWCPVMVSPMLLLFAKI